MSASQPSLTISEALAQGYTHFALGSPDEFYVYPLSLEEVETQRKAWDDEYGGNVTPRLCSKETKSPSINAEDLMDLLTDRFEIDDELSPNMIAAMAQEGHKEEEFIKITEALNKYLSDYKTYSDTDILLTLD